MRVDGWSHEMRDARTIGPLRYSLVGEPLSTRLEWARHVGSDAAAQIESQESIVELRHAILGDKPRRSARIWWSRGAAAGSREFARTRNARREKRQVGEVGEHDLTTAPGCSILAVILVSDTS